jgi:6,7-dimethyl-8-ribityllumazine synthase
MSTLFEGKLSGEGVRVGIAVARFNSLFGEQLLAGCKDGLLRHGVNESDIATAWVPGAMELPLICQKFAEGGEYDAVIALGCVIRGATPHFDHVATGVSRGCAQIGLDTGVPVIFGVLTTDSLEQAMERSGTKAGNKGFDAAMAALEMCDLLSQIPGGEDA